MNDRGMTVNEIHSVSIGVFVGSWATPPFNSLRAFAVAIAFLVGLHFWRLVFKPIYRWRDRIVAQYTST